MVVVAFLSMGLVFAAFLPHQVVVGKVSKDGSSSLYASSKADWGQESKPFPGPMRAVPRQAFIDVPLGQECDSYKNLSSADRAERAMTSLDAGACDRNDFSPGWYRFIGDAGDKMAESCVPILRCMTAATGWLNGAHPTDSTIVTREVCFHWKKGCCDIKVNIRIKLCRGFYIYELPTTPSCNLRYCGNAVGAMTKPSKCGGNLTSLTGQVTSPGYPNYMEPISCHWTIKAPFGGSILLYFENITFGHGGCFSNNLTVQGDKTETFCYRRDLNSFSILVAKRTVDFFYKSVYWNKKLGFKLNYFKLKENLENAQAHSQWNISAKVNGPSSIHVSWKKFDNSFKSPSQTLYGLVVVCKPLKVIKRTVHVMVQHSATDVEVTGLTGGIEYKVQVVALLNDAGSVSTYGSDTARVTTSKGACEKYRNLTSHRRSQSEPGGPYCDQSQIYTPHWYRFAGDAGTQIATSCVPQERCHTHSPGWMDGTHPSVQDGVVMRTVCFHRLGHCCRWEVTIRVRNCDGFYVYQLHYPPICKMGYCGSSGGCGKYINDAYGTLTSPGYPKRIYWNSKCLWNFAAPSSYGVIVVVVEDLRIPGSPPCLKFSLLLQDGTSGKQVGQACGVQRFFTWVSERSAKLKFLADKADSSWVGFKARYFIFSGSLTDIPVIPQWTGVSARALNSTAITVQWGPYSNMSVTEYLIMCVPDGLPLNATVFIKEYADVSQFSLVVTGLMEFTNYTVQIVVQTSLEKSSFSGYKGSDKTRVRTKEDVPSEGPSDVKATIADKNRVVVRWGPIPKHARNGIITHYVIYYKKALTAKPWTQMSVTKPVMNGNRMIAYLEGLEPGKYVMQMAGSTVAGVGTKSKEIYFVIVEPSTTTPIPTTLPPTPEKDLRMYPYGVSAGDSMMPNTIFYLDQCLRINIPGDGMQFFTKRHHMIHICRNGLLLFETSRSIRWPYRLVEERLWLRDVSLLAPYWALIDAGRAFGSRGISKVYYQTYNDTDNRYISRKMILQATYDVKNLHLDKPKLYSGDFTKPRNFKAKWVLVITWVNLRPFGADRLDFKLTNTFQAVLITDGKYSFAMYNYPENGIQWAVAAPLDKHHLYEGRPGLPVAGWNVGRGKFEHYDVKGSGQTAMARIDTRHGKTVKIDLRRKKIVEDTISKGKWFFRLEAAFHGGRSPRDRCISWFKTQPDHADYTENLEPCPCTKSQASNDQRFKMDSKGWPIICAKSVFPSNQGWTQKCCYSKRKFGALVQGYPGGGYPISSIDYYPFKYDEFAYKKCCVESSSCDLFYKKRPSDDCWRYIHPQPSLCHGDPHFVTLDGLNYTFNGLGEYIMADISNGLFQLQARTKLVEGGGKATVFVSAVAKQTGSSAVQVNLKPTGGLEVLVNGTVIDHTTLTNTTTRYNGSVALSRPDTTSITVLFPCGVSVKMTDVKDSLAIVLAAPEKFKNKTRGLLGVWNGDPEDDLTTPIGRVVPTNAKGRTIHDDFGQLWQVTESTSLFTYKKGEGVDTFSDPSFMPMFIEDFNFTSDAVKQKAMAECGNDLNCLFDAALSNDVSMGTSTKSIGSNFKNESEALKNKAPMFLNHSSSITVTVNTTARIEIVAKDADGDPLTFSVSGTLPKDMVKDTSSGHSVFISWKVTMEKIKFEFTVMDDKGAAALWRPKVHVCACHNGGHCSPDSNNVFADSTNDTFLIMPCNCIHGYTGKFCENDLDACQANLNPCYPGVKCTDLPPPAGVFGYRCGPCPPGFTGDGATCLDIDECQRINQGCSQVCVNTPGSFVCDCNQGYRLSIDQRTCNDIDECFPSSDCMQKCKNTEGNYTCECNDGFKVDPNNRKKCVAKLPCSNGDHGCQHICYMKDGRQQCACHQGYELMDDQKTCKDIDECKPEIKRCSQHCNNTVGSYKCWCKKGFRLDRDLITCVDVDECMELTYQCPDPSQLCLNTEGTYKCVCGEGLYLTKNNTCREIDGPVPPEKPDPPKTPTETEKGNSINITVQGLNVDKWYKPLDKKFKDAVAKAVTHYCANKDEDCKKGRERERRALDYILYTADQVHLLSGFPKQINLKSRELAAVIAFYVEFPPEVVSTSGDSIEGGILVEVVSSAKADIEKALNRTISSITLFNAEQPETKEKDKPKSSSYIIGASVGAVVLLVIVVVVVVLVRRHVNKNRMQEKNRRGRPSPGINNQSYDGIGEGAGEAFQFRPVSTGDGNQYVQLGKDNPNVDYSEIAERPQVDEKPATQAEYSEIPAKPGAESSYAEIAKKPGEDEKNSEIAEKPAGAEEKVAL